MNSWWYSLVYIQYRSTWHKVSGNPGWEKFLQIPEGILVEYIIGSVFSILPLWTQSNCIGISKSKVLNINYKLPVEVMQGKNKLLIIKRQNAIFQIAWHVTFFKKITRWKSFSPREGLLCSWLHLFRRFSAEIQVKWDLCRHTNS